jgi:hypothetical protein
MTAKNQGLKFLPFLVLSIIYSFRSSFLTASSKDRFMGEELELFLVKFSRLLVSHFVKPFLI